MPKPKLSPPKPRPTSFTAPQPSAQMPWAGQRGTMEDLSSFGVSPEDFFGGGGRIMFSDTAPKPALTPKQGNMTTEQAYIEGFVKRASEYGFNEDEAFELLKKSTAADAPQSQQDPSFFRGLKNFGINAMRAPKALYNGLMGNDSAIEHPASVPFVTGGSVGPKGLAGIPGRIMNYAQHLDRTKDQRPDIAGAGMLIGARLGDLYADSKPEHRDSSLAHVGARLMGGSIGGNALPLVNQQRESMWSTPPSK